eukprot:8601226-Alexandrium_andersonii.AAC.1
MPLEPEPAIHDLQALRKHLELRLVVERSSELARQQLVERAGPRILVERLTAGHLQLSAPDLPLGEPLAQLGGVLALARVCPALVVPPLGDGLLRRLVPPDEEAPEL